MFGAEAEVSLLLNFRSPLILLYSIRILNIKYLTVFKYLTVHLGQKRAYRWILGVRYLSNRLTSGYAANTNKTYEGKSSYAMYFMPYIVDSVVGFINDENMAPRDVSAPNGAQ